MQFANGGIGRAIHAASRRDEPLAEKPY